MVFGTPGLLVRGNYMLIFFICDVLHDAEVIFKYVVHITHSAKEVWQYGGLQTIAIDLPHTL